VLATLLFAGPTIAEDGSSARRAHPNDGHVEVLLITAILNSDGTIELRPWYRSLDGAPSPSEPGNYAIKVLDMAGATVAEVGASVSFEVSVDPFGTAPTTAAPLIMKVPYPMDAFSVEIVRTGQVIARVNVPTKLLADAVKSIPEAGFGKNPSERRNALLEKINALDAQLSAKDLRGARQKLQNDIRKQLDEWLVNDYPIQTPLQYTKLAILALVDEILQRLGA
jgi:hypothetical protein